MGSKDQLNRKSFTALLAVNSELVRLYWDIGRRMDARHGKARSNFALTLPKHQFDLIQQTLKQHKRQQRLQFEVPDVPFVTFWRPSPHE